MKWPKKVKHRKQVLAKIYRPCEGRDSYRVAWKVGGKRMMKSFRTYGGKGGALEYAEDLVPDLAKGSQVTRLTPGQANDALAALERLDAFYKSTGRRVSLLAVASEWAEVSAKLGPHTPSEAAEGFLSTVVTVKRMDIAKAAEDFITARKPKTVAKEGKRPQLSAGYAYNVAMWLREFAKTFPGNAVCDITRKHLELYFGKHSEVSPKTRNERRNVVRMFLKWSVRQDYLRADNRLLEADCMAKEVYEPEEIALYTAAELRGMLERASKRPEPAKEGEEPEAVYTKLLPIISLIALGGVRLQEAVRLTWEDVFKVEGHVEISSAKSKTRSRRLVTIGPALAGWLEPYRNHSGPIWTECLDKFHSDFNELRGSLKIPAKRNGLRHGFCTFHYALHSDEGLTAKEAGNSPAMVHGSYKGLSTKKDGEAWFAVAPAQAANVIQLATAAGSIRSPSA
jgi:integrase